MKNSEDTFKPIDKIDRVASKIVSVINEKHKKGNFFAFAPKLAVFLFDLINNFIVNLPLHEREVRMLVKELAERQRRAIRAYGHMADKFVGGSQRGKDNGK